MPWSARLGQGSFFTRFWIIIGLTLAGLLLRYGVVASVKGDEGFNAYLRALCVWDCHHYLEIIEHGYEVTVGSGGRMGSANWAFFPLAPLLTWLTRMATGLPILVAGFLLANAYIITATLAAYPLFERNDTGRAYWLFAFSVLVGPFSFLFSTLYTEGLFILLTVLVLAALQRSDYLQAGLWAALLSATRVTGVLIVFAILLQAVLDHRRKGGTWRALPMAVLGNSRLMLAFFVAPLGLFGYMLYLHFHMGDGFAFFHIQRAWDREFGNPFVFVWEAIRFDGPQSSDAMQRFAWGWAAVFSLGLTLVLAWRGRLAAALFCGLALLTSLSAGVMSMLRFSAGLVPLGIVLSELLSLWRPLYYLAFPVMLLLGIATTTGWVRLSQFVM